MIPLFNTHKSVWIQFVEKDLEQVFRTMQFLFGRTIRTRKYLDASKRINQLP